MRPRRRSGAAEAVGGGLRCARRWVVAALVALVGGYQRVVSPLLPPTCRFQPSCSEYAVQAVRVHGPLRGCWLAARRLVRCGPWHPGGVDPVPPARESRPVARSTTPSEESLPC